FYRVPDETVVSPEEQYYRELSATGALSATAPLSGSLRRNFIQTDDFYADRVPTAWRGRLLFVPDLAVGRLVETPSDMLRYLDAAAATEYTIDAAPDGAKALVTGYPFVDDEAQTFANQLQQFGFKPGGQPELETLISRSIANAWNVETLKGVWLGGAAAQHQLAVFDGHFTHNTLIAADGSVLRADQLPSVTNYFNNALLFALGCHSGLSATDGSFGANGPDDDFAQMVLQHGGTWLGNTGYTYADPYTIGYSQRLAQWFVAQIGRPVSDTLGYAGASLGDSVARAKQSYLHELGPSGLSVSDEKALTQLTLYGLPFLRVKVPVPRDVPVPAPVDATGKPPQFTRLITVTNSFTMEQTPDGQIPRVVAQVFDPFANRTTTITSTGQMAPGRPVLPALSYDITLACSLPCTPPEPRGVRLLDATTLPELSSFAPHVTTTVTDPVRLTGANTITREEPGMTAQNVWVPDIPYTYQRLSVISGTEPISSDRLLISPTQFSATDATHGRLRQFETMVFEVSYVRPDPQVLGCGWFQRVCNWFSGKSRVSK
ncbi:MAG TPA: hypothetical protein VFX76_05240, partial [Roseiflexaceae bacterium]|nr:hypothetical protein [Roseiflexaceae bacterium]